MIASNEGGNKSFDNQNKPNEHQNHEESQIDEEELLSQRTNLLKRISNQTIDIEVKKYHDTDIAEIEEI